MRGFSTVLIVVLGFWLAAILQQSLAPRLAIGGGSPDFLILFAFCLSLVSRPGAGALLGLASGAIQGALTGATLAHFVLSRAAIAFGLSYVDQSGVDLGRRTAAVSIGVATLVSQLVLMLLAPPTEIGPYLRATIFTATYNGVLAIPLYGLLRRHFQPKV